MQSSPNIPSHCPNPKCKRKLTQFQQRNWTSYYCSNKCYSVKVQVYKTQDDEDEITLLSETIFIHPYTIHNTWNTSPWQQLTLRLQFNPEINKGCHISILKNEEDKLEGSTLITSLTEPKAFDSKQWDSIKDWIVNIITFL